MSDELVCEILTIAADRIADPMDWCKGTLGLYEHEHGPVCAVGAVRYARYKLFAQRGCDFIGAMSNEMWSSEPIQEVLNAAVRAIEIMTKVVDRDVPMFNDSPHTTHEDVVDMYAKAKEVVCPAKVSS